MASKLVGGTRGFDALRATCGGVMCARLVAKVAFVEEGQGALGVEVSVERDVAVCQVVVARVGIQELLIGERGNGARIAARLASVGGVGEQCTVHGVVQHVHGVGEGALHLVEHHAVVTKALGRAVFGTVELVVPALLLKDGLFGIDGGV